MSTRLKTGHWALATRSEYPSSKSRSFHLRRDGGFFSNDCAVTRMEILMTYRYSSTLAVLTSALLCACATPTVVQSVKPGDNGLSCGQLQNEYVDAERFRAEADKEKSMTGGNVVRALFFWPAILGTAANANEAMAAADSRKVHLANQMNSKNCSIPVGAVVIDSTSATATPQSKEVKLAELKRLHDANLITKEVYAERQKSILDSSTQ